MKRILFFLAITMASIQGLLAGPVSAADARQIADSFFAGASTRFSAAASHAAPRLAYTADANRFYVFDNKTGNGFVVIAGDDRVPQVLGYSDKGTFDVENIPLAMQDWMAEMNREIAYLQTHSDVAVHHPVVRATAVEPLMTTLWDQGWPYNNLCPTYSVQNGDPQRAVTGCIATAMAQVMKYHEWPLQGRGSHTYNCVVNETDYTTLSADFSQSVYQWDKMLDTYDENSSQESCDAVARLMSDAGISVNMNYGSSSGAQEVDVVKAWKRYFGYSDRLYLLSRDLYGADEWDQLLVDELSARRPILYCGYSYSQTGLGGHAFVLDGFNTKGYFHVNWGWGGSSNGYFLVSVLAPSNYNFKYGQDGIFGVVPDYRADEVQGVLYVKGALHPEVYAVSRGSELKMTLTDTYLEGNLIDTVGIEGSSYWQQVYDTIPMELRIQDNLGNTVQTKRFSQRVYANGGGWSWVPSIVFTPDASLADGEYAVKLAYSSHKDGNYDSWVSDDYGRVSLCKMLLTGDEMCLMDCFLSDRYYLESMDPGRNLYVNEPFDVDVTLVYPPRHGPSGSSQVSPWGDIHLVLMKDGQEVAASESLTISIPNDSIASYQLQIQAPEHWGRYELMLVDDRGQMFVPRPNGWFDDGASGAMNVIILPRSEELVEDFESMPVSTKTNDTNVQGAFTKWNFNKSGVRAPGEGKCYGSNSVMMKKPSAFYTVEPVSHHIFMAEATFFNNSAIEAKYTLEYSIDNGATWKKAMTVDGTDVGLVAASGVTRILWHLNVGVDDQTLFRIAMTGGGSAATYVDDFVLHYNDMPVAGDVNHDGEVNIGDVNAVIEVIQMGDTIPTADINGDGEVNVGDVNALIDMILAQ